MLMVTQPTDEKIKRIFLQKLADKAHNP